jgi:hypothetical protein
MTLLREEETVDPSIWSPTLQFYTLYSLRDILPVVKLIASRVVEVERHWDLSQHDDKAPKSSVRAKYAGKKFKKISLRPELRGELVNKLAAGTI